MNSPMTVTFIQGHKCVLNVTILELPISQTIFMRFRSTFKLGMTVDLWMPYLLMLVSMTLTLMQGHSGSAKAKNQRCMLSATKQAISIELATTVGHFLLDLDLDFANVYMDCLTCTCTCTELLFLASRFPHTFVQLYEDAWE